MPELENKISIEKQDELAKQTARATLDFLPQLREDLGKTDQEAADQLRKYIEIIEKNISLPGVREVLTSEEQIQINQTLRNSKIKVKYLESNHEGKNE